MPRGSRKLSVLIVSSTLSSAPLPRDHRDVRSRRDLSCSSLVGCCLDEGAWRPALPELVKCTDHIAGARSLVDVDRLMTLPTAPVFTEAFRNQRGSTRWILETHACSLEGVLTGACCLLRGLLF
jgi:hypothetical protein